jgi:hypothetical protein
MIKSVGLGALMRSLDVFRIQQRLDPEFGRQDSQY